MNKLNPEQHAFWVQDRLNHGETLTEIAAQLEVSRSTVSKFVHENGLTQPGSAAALPSKPQVGDEVTEAERLQAELTEVRRVMRKARVSEVNDERIITAIKNVLPPAEPAFSAAQYAPRETEHRPHVQALLLSDTHAGEIVDPEAMNGMNEYNWDIMEQRMLNIVSSLQSYRSTRTYDVEELQVWVLGDMLSGNNHFELAVTNELPIAEQAYRFGLTLGKFIEQLVPLYPKITVYAVPGNHPRVSIKPANKQVFNNWDWISYLFAQTYLENYESVAFNTTRAGQLVVPIAGRTALLWHGDGIRSSMPGVPWGGVMRRVNELRRQYADQGVDLDYFALGHFHQANVVQGSVFMNGSVKGPDEYTLKQFGSGEQPRQLLITFDPRKQRPTDVSFIDP